jgi:hypothetical protein
MMNAASGSLKKGSVLLPSLPHALIKRSKRIARNRLIASAMR